MSTGLGNIPKKQFFYCGSKTITMGYSDKQIQEGYGISNEGSSGSCALLDSGMVVGGCMGCLQKESLLEIKDLPLPNCPNIFIITCFNRMRY